MINIVDNVKPNLFYKFNEKYYTVYNIRKETVETDDENFNTVYIDIYKYDEFEYQSKPSIDKFFKDLQEVEYLSEELKQQYLDCYSISD